MDLATTNRCLRLLEENPQCRTLDITGGEPELHPDFKYIVIQAGKMGKKVTVRHNLTVTIDENPINGESMEYLPEFFAENRVTVLASLPHYQKEIAEQVRGTGIFIKSIESIRRLNGLGFGIDHSGLTLNIVYNHKGPLTPEHHKQLEEEFKQELLSRYGIVFNELLTVTNMPIKRFRNQLEKQGTYIDYMDSLKRAFSVTAASSVACRSLISIDSHGRIYDCDFNLALGLQSGEREPLTVSNCNAKSILDRNIKFGSHCFGCTSGGGSS
jgi:radical SAM/Cys-rich protein